MKLNLKNSAHYLPYDIGVIVPDENGICIIECMNEQSVFIDSGCDYAFEDVKLVLRPLSDLTKEIEINGADSLPMDTLYPLFNEHLPTGLSSYGMRKKIELHPLSMPYFILEKLFEWHFDVFRLIPQCLAIDINTI